MTAPGDDFDVVTGVLSYSGAAIAGELQAAGRRVRTLTGHPGRAPAGTPIEIRPLDFTDPAGGPAVSGEGAGVGRRVDLAEPVHRNQGVDLRGGDGRVAQ